MTPIIVRAMTEDDLPQVADLYRLFWNDEQDLTRMRALFTALRDSETHIFLVAAIGGTVAGTIMGIVCHELYGACRPFLLMDDLVVHQDHRRRDVGRRLLTALEDLGRGRGCTQVLFVTESNRADSIAFYERCGYDADTHQGFKKKLS